MRAWIVDADKIRAVTAIDDIRAALEAKQLIWIDLQQQSADADELLVKTVDVHQLTIEDIWAQRAQPKLEDYRNYLYVIAHGVCGTKRGLYESIEIDVLIGKTFIISHDPHGVTTTEVLADLERDPRLLSRGPAWLAHSLLDRVVDRYIPVVDELDTQLESLTTDALEKAGTKKGQAVMRRILRYKRMLQNLRRISVHQREILLRLSRGDFEEIPREVVPFLRDVNDHFLRINDLIESYRDLVTSALEAYLSVQSNRMNEVMKTLTMISTVMLPLSFIAGLYGMNFRHMPELDWVLGYPFALVLMAVVTTGILLWFRYKGWLGGDREDDKHDH
jgi:magnesium transporter